MSKFEIIDDAVSSNWDEVNRLKEVGALSGAIKLLAQIVEYSTDFSRTALKRAILMLYGFAYGIFHGKYSQEASDQLGLSEGDCEDMRVVIDALVRPFWSLPKRRSKIVIALVELHTRLVQPENAAAMLRSAGGISGLCAAAAERKRKCEVNHEPKVVEAKRASRDIVDIDVPAGLEELLKQGPVELTVCAGAVDGPPVAVKMVSAWEST